MRENKERYKEEEEKK